MEINAQQITSGKIHLIEDLNKVSAQNRFKKDFERMFNARHMAFEPYAKNPAQVEHTTIGAPTYDIPLNQGVYAEDLGSREQETTGRDSAHE